MKRHLPVFLTVVCCLVPVVMGQDAQINVTSGGSSSVTVFPDDVINYDVHFQLSELSPSNAGLAGLLFDLKVKEGASDCLSCPPLVRGAEPTASPLTNFVAPLGLSDPIGYSGTEQDGGLINIGGLQHPGLGFFSFVGTVMQGAAITGIGDPAQPAQSVYSAQLDAPDIVGTYTLTVENALVNVLDLGLDATRVAEAASVSSSDLEITVEYIDQSSDQVSISSIQPVTMDVKAGVSHAGWVYLMLGSTSGTSPGMSAGGGKILPLNFDFYTYLLLALPNSALLQNSYGLLDSQGEATATFNLPTLTSPALAGLTMNHAAVIFGPGDRVVSEAEPLTITP